MPAHKSTNFPVIATAEDKFALNGASPGGYVKRGTAGMSLNVGDFVVRVPGINRWFKTLGSSYYAGGLLTGVVVGGSLTDFNVLLSSGDIAQAAATIGTEVVIMTRGVCYAVADATGIKAGKSLGAGRTTAGRVLSDHLNYFAEINPGLKISAGTVTVAEAEFAARTIFAGGPGTTLVAGVDMAALAGSILNGAYGMWEQRVASNGTTVTTAPGLLTAATKAALTLPTGSAALITLGFIIVHPTGTGSFVGGTTGLADGTVVPNTEYYNLIGNFAPRGAVLEDGGAAGTAVLIELF